MERVFIESIDINWDRISSNSYLREIEALKTLNHMDFLQPVTFFVGENGSGKSTLLEGIAVAYGLNAEGGSWNYHFSTYDSHSELHNAIWINRSLDRPAWSYFLRAESFYNVATMEEEYRGDRSLHLHEHSHGESFQDALEEALQPNGLYLFDEPEAALSPQRQLTLLAEIYEHAKYGAQFIISTHSPILLGLPNAKIYCFDDGPIHECSYEETSTYKIMSLYINHKDQILKNLFIEDEK